MKNTLSAFPFVKKSSCSLFDDAPPRSRKQPFTSCSTWPASRLRRLLGTWSVLLAASLASGCGTIQPTHAEGRYVTTQHGVGRFQDALEGARQHCAKLGLGVRHLGTETPFKSISRFECIEPKQ
jgi:hypothetical protein